MNRLTWALVVALAAALSVPACSSSSGPTTPPGPGGGSTPSGIFAGQVRVAGSSTAVEAAVVNLTINDVARSATTPADGTFRFTGLPAGTAQVTAQATGFEAITRAVTLTSGEVVQNLELTPPPTPTPTPTPTKFVTLARVLDVVTGRAVSGVRGVHPQVTSTASGSTGRLELSSPMALGGIMVRFDGDATVSREAFLQLPGADVLVTVIPETFDLVAFDEMAREPAIRRWLSPPPLMVEQRVLKYSDLDAGTLQASATVRTEADVNELIGHLTTALPDLTGGTITNFSNIDRHTAAEDAAVPITVSGQISVFLVEGLLAGSGFEGFARWEFRNFVVTGGVILLDATSDRGPNRQWLRAHELGHTLGYNHVTTRASLMAPSASPITTFDRQAGRLAYTRPPGNRSPDIDPADSSLNVMGPRRWSAWIGSVPHAPEAMRSGRAR